MLKKQNETKFEKKIKNINKCLFKIFIWWVIQIHFNSSPMGFNLMCNCICLKVTRESQDFKVQT